jgi:DNA-binding LacI/PurR family transcriptional regulator
MVKASRRSRGGATIEDVARIGGVSAMTVSRVINGKRNVRESTRDRRGLDVPHDLSVVGFDDTMPATTVWPELTTIRQTVAEMAEAAIELLMADLRSGDEEPREIERLLRHELIVRDSAAPAAESTRASRSGSLFQGKTGRP